MDNWDIALLNKLARERRAKEIIAASGADTPECLAKAEGITHGATFREQAAWWIKHVQHRNRKPIAPATLESWEGCLDVWILPNLGDLLLVSVGNLALKGLVEKMVKAGLSPTGFLFHNRKGNYLSQTNLLRRGLHPALEKLGQPKAGFHAFRRFRTTWLRKNRTPEDLIRFWLGHADETVTDGYSKLAEDVEYRKQVAAEVGQGFEISAQKPVVVPNVPSFALSVVQENVA